MTENPYDGWYAPDDPTPREQCPCCDYVTLPERRSYLICPVCYWEDDGVDVDDVDRYSGPNHMTLRQGRTNFKEFGSVHKHVLQYVASDEERKMYAYHPREIE